MRISVFGHSHSHALAAAAKERADVAVYRERNEKRDGISHHEFAEIAKGSLMVLATGGDHYAALSTLTSERVPYRVMLDYFEYTVKQAEYTYMKSFAGNRLVQIVPPPPKPDGEMLRDYVRERHGKRVQLASEDYRMSAWKAYRHKLYRWSRKFDVTVLEPPPMALDDRGFLKPEYWERDVTHANAAYGALQLDRLAAIAQGMEPADCSAEVPARASVSA